MNWWITFADRAPACVYGGTEDKARELAARSGTVETVTTLPYPARPRLDDREGWGDGQCPSFCHTPHDCAGRTSCPRRPSCVD